MRLRLRQRGAEWILQRRVDEHELGLGGFGGRRQRVHIQAVVAARDADGDAAVVAYQRQQVAVAGVFDQHRVAGLVSVRRIRSKAWVAPWVSRICSGSTGNNSSDSVAARCWRSVGKPSGWP